VVDKKQTDKDILEDIASQAIRQTWKMFECLTQTARIYRAHHTLISFQLLANTAGLKAFVATILSEGTKV
jgi:hypothetical protein